ncbi:MAG: archease [Proteobacteria bacterium]|nr:archease [Pseudomonadota bacterium]
MNEKSFDYFDHAADIGIIGRGETVVAAFISAAQAVFAYMADLDQVKPLDTVSIQFNETDRELALVQWLNLLIGAARQRGMIFSSFSLSQKGDNWIGQASGEPWREDLERGTEVKGATLTMLSVKQYAQFYEARCVVDV